jgi:hypothetical protein
MSDELNNNTIQDKFDSREFDVNEDNWNKLRPELDKLEKKKKRRALLYFIIPGVLLFISFILFLNHKENRVLTDSSVVNKEKPDETITQKKNERGASNPEQRYQAESKEQKKIEGVVKEADSFTSATTINTSEGKSSEKNSVSPELSKTKDPSHTFRNQGKAEVNLSKTKKENSSLKDTATTETATTVEDSNGNVTVKSKEKDIPLPVSEQENKPDTLTNSGVITETQNADSLKLYPDSNIVAVSQKTDSLVPVNKDSLSNKKDSLDKQKPGLEIFASAYLAFTPGYQGPLNYKDAFNPSAGIGIRKFFSPKLGMGTGIYYTIYSNISADPKLFQSTTQDFGYTATITEITQKRLHYVKVPLTLELKLNKNNFSVGAEFMYLLTSASQIRTYNESFGTVTEISTKKEYGYINGFSSYDIGAVIMYSRRLNRKLSFSALVNMGFVDIKNNTYFSSGSFERNRSLQLGISYQFN